MLFVAAETLRRLALLTQPFMPESASRLLDQLCVPRDPGVSPASAPITPSAGNAIAAADRNFPALCGS